MILFQFFVNFFVTINFASCLTGENRSSQHPVAVFSPIYRPINSSGGGGGRLGREARDNKSWPDTSVVNIWPPEISFTFLQDGSHENTMNKQINDQVLCLKHIYDVLCLT